MTYVEQKLLEERIGNLENRISELDNKIQLIETWLKQNP